MVSSGHLTRHRGPTHTTLQIKYKKIIWQQSILVSELTLHLDMPDISWSDGLSEFYYEDINCPMTGNFKTEVPNGSTTYENNCNVKSRQVTIKSQTYIALKITGGPCCFRLTYPVTKITLIQFKINTPHRTLLCHVTSLTQNNYPKYIR